MRIRMVPFALCYALLSWGPALALGPVRSATETHVRQIEGPPQGQPVWRSFCGDGHLDPGEECDPGNEDLGTNPDLGGKTCEGEGYNRGDLGCTDTCRLERSDCSCVSTGVPATVPKTGQTGCWDADGHQIDCAGTGQDGEYQTGVAADPRFTDNGDGTVKDNLTGLIWLKNANCFGEQNWMSALSDANTLASGTCGLTDGSVAGDWRLPNVKELQSLLDFGGPDPSLPPGHPFSGVGYTNYWSSTTYTFDPSGARVVGLGGGDGGYYKSSLQFVWPVRGGR